MVIMIHAILVGTITRAKAKERSPTKPFTTTIRTTTTTTTTATATATINITTIDTIITTYIGVCISFFSSS